MNSYQRIKDHISHNLKKLPSPLQDEQIKAEIDMCRSLINQMGLETFALFLPDKSKLSNLQNDDWDRIERELETQFDVKMTLGILIQGSNHDNRDAHWWSSKQKQVAENYYWGRYQSYISNHFIGEVVNVLNKDTDIIMDNIENPELSSFNRYGMVVGHVQSGKTANYSALVCKAADAGYKFIVVVAGGMNNLRDQTQARLNESFVGQDMGRQVGVGIGDSDREKLPISLTTKEKDFNKQDADKNSQGLNFDNINVPILLVIKKNTKTLANVISWLENQYKNQIKKHAMLLIDDESDYASINTKEEQDPTTINKRLRKLISLFQKSAYVAYTATPYANIFIDHEVGHNELGKDLFPRDFIYALDAPSNYLGARKIFLDSEEKHLVPIDDYLECFPTKHKKDWNLPSIPNSLRDATRLFVINIGIRYLRGQIGEHNSMLIHASRYTNVHQRIANHIGAYLETIKHEVKAYGLLPEAHRLSDVIAELKVTFEQQLSFVEFSWDKVLEAITVNVSGIVVREVHQSTSVPLIYRKDMATNVIVVGGTSLSRGYTLEGLTVSYFLRNTVFYDTLMQMGRWFGYRPGYEDLCRIYLPHSVIKNFAQIIEATEDLIDDFKRMSDANMTPNDFGLAVRHHPDSGLQVTARNKQKNAQDIYFDMKLDGHAKETAWLSIDPSIKAKNLSAINSIISNLNNSPGSYEMKGNSYLWRNVKKNLIIDFLNSFEIFGADDELGFRTRMPIKFILKYANDIDTLWDVGLYNGTGSSHKIATNNGIVDIKKELRKVNIKDLYLEIMNRQVSSGTAEAIALDDKVAKEIGSKRKDIRAVMKKPLLMLHILETDADNSLAAFGVSFPGGINSGNQTIRLKINTVYLNSLMDEVDESYDD